MLFALQKPVGGVSVLPPTKSKKDKEDDIANGMTLSADFVGHINKNIKYSCFQVMNQTQMKSHQAGEGYVQCLNSFKL